MYILKMIISENKVADTNVGESGKDINVATNETKFLLSENAYNDVKDIIDLTQKEAEKDKRQFVKLKDNTTPQLVELRAEDLPMLERVGHVRENILAEGEAKKLGFSINDKHFHGLGIDTYLNIIDSMEDATNIYQYTNNEKHFIIETPVEINRVKSLVPVFLKREDFYNNVSIDYNKTKTVFAPQNDYINTLLKEGKIKKTVTDVSRQQSPSMANNISQNNQKVNDSNETKYSFSEQLERSLEKTVVNAEQERQGIFNTFNYLEILNLMDINYVDTTFYIILGM